MSTKNALKKIEHFLHRHSLTVHYHPNVLPIP